MKVIIASLVLLFAGCSTPPIKATVDVASPKVASENQRRDVDNSATSQQAGPKAVQVRARDVSVDGGTLTIIIVSGIGIVMAGYLMSKGVLKIGTKAMRKKK